LARRNKSRGDHVLRHVRMHHYMMGTEAWKSLGVTERAMYLDIASRYAGFGTNNGKIHYSVRAAAESLHISKSTAARSLATLEERGFIVSEKRGAFSLKARHATEWRLTEFPSDIRAGELATKEFVRWSSQKQNTGAEAGPYGYSSGTSRYPQRDRAGL
jgi:DNA-binding transcriptional MocR family regulator